MTTVPTTYSAGDALTATTLNSNLSTLAGAIDAIKTNNITTNAGIVSKQLADRYSVQDGPPICVLPMSQDATPASPAHYTLGAATKVTRQYASLPTGREAYLVEIQAWCLEMLVNAGGYPQLDFYVNTNKVATILLLASNTIYRVANANKFTSPLFSLADGDEIRVELSASTGSPTAAGVYLKYVLRLELSN